MAKTKDTERKIIKIPSGSYGMNLMMSGRWDYSFESGRIVEIYGHNGSGKSTTAWHIGQNALLSYRKAGIKTNVNICDAEFKLDESYLQKVISEKDYNLKRENICEEIWGWVFDGLNKGEKIFIVDSVGNMTSHEQRKRGIEKMGFTSVAKEMSWGLRNYGRDVYKQNAFLIFVNHVAFKIGVMFGDNETTPGGDKLKFDASYRIKIWTTRGSAEKIKTKDLTDVNEIAKEIETGIVMKMKSVKNDTAPPYRLANVPLKYGYGIDKLKDFMMFLEQIGFLIKIEKTSKYKIKGFKIESITEKKLTDELLKSTSKIKIKAIEYTKKYGFEVME